VRVARAVSRPEHRELTTGADIVLSTVEELDNHRRQVPGGPWR